MSIYKPTKTKRTKINYRKIYKEHFGPIPLDEKGRVYDIHHIDGNDKNNEASNLMALSIVDHFWEHWINGDYGACYVIAMKMKMSPGLISELARKSNKQRVENGTHNWLDGTSSKKRAREKVENGTHHFLGGKIQKERVEKGTHHFLDKEMARKRAIKQISQGIHPFLDKEAASKRAKERVARGEHHFQNPPKIICPHCGKIGANAIMRRWHFDKCKQKP